MLGLVPCEVFGYLLSGRVVDDVSRGATAYLCVVSLLPKSLSHIGVPLSSGTVRFPDDSAVAVAGCVRCAGRRAMAEWTPSSCCRPPAPRPAPRPLGLLLIFSVVWQGE